MSGQDGPEGTGGTDSGKPELSAGDPDTPAGSVNTAPLRQEALQQLRQAGADKPGRAKFWRDRNLGPARGLVLAIPVGVVLWVVAIYVFTKLM